MSFPFASFTFALALLCLSGCARSDTTSPAPSASPARGDSSRNSLDWPGSYAGVLPCADCEGIETTITIRSDQTYALRTRYLGTGDAGRTREGTFAWNEEGNQITLGGISSAPSRYLVGEDKLIQLDLAGDRITGELAGRYVLRRTSEVPPTISEALVAPARWRLTELGGRPVPSAGDPARDPSLTFERDGARVHGFAGCNHFSGSCELRPGSRVRFSAIAATQMACSDMTLETEFFEVLAAADNYALQGSVLSLNRARMAPLARFEAVDR